jgi:hemolysin-activating ACP:hemolysin acyltransferase
MADDDLPSPLGKADRVPTSKLRLFRPDNPYVALGLAVNYMMTKPAFAALRFGDWSRILVGQINRKHYYLVIGRNNQVEGFLGWAVTTKEKAEAWVEGRERISYQDSFEGDSLLINAWAASSLEVNRFLLDAARRLFKEYDTLYFKRYYKDGRIKPWRLRMDRDQDDAYIAAALAFYERAREDERGQGQGTDTKRAAPTRSGIVELTANDCRVHAPRRGAAGATKR